MNEKLNDKPIEMPARGRPRKKEPGLDHSIYGNDYDAHNNLYNGNNFSQFINSCSESNSILDYIEGSSDRDSSGLNNMYPYKNEYKGSDVFRPQLSPLSQNGRLNTQTHGVTGHREGDWGLNKKEENNCNREQTVEDMMEKFNKIGEIFNSHNTSSGGPTEESFQISPKDVQHSRSDERFKSSSFEHKRNSSSENDKFFARPLKTPFNSQSSDIFSLDGTNSSMFGESNNNSDQSPLTARDCVRPFSNGNNNSYLLEGLDSSIPSIYNVLQNNTQNNSRENDRPNNYNNKNEVDIHFNNENQFQGDLQFRLRGNNYIDPFQTGGIELNAKRVNINTPIHDIPQFSPNRHYNPRFYSHQSPSNTPSYLSQYGKQQWHSQFQSENQTPLSQFRKSVQPREGNYHNSSVDYQNNSIPDVLQDTMNILGANPWYNRKKRKSNPLLWQYTKHPQGPDNIMHPSKYSSIDYIQGIDSNQVYQAPLNRNFNERDGNNSILPLFLSSNKELTDEYKDVVTSFKQRIHELDFTNVTVQQLKLFMREFGLNHTGKKNELIDRLKSTLNKLDSRNTSKQVVEVKKPPETKDEGYGAYFF